MFGLNEIVKMNREAAEAAPLEDNHNRHCSYSGDSRVGIVLHSARLRNTAFLPPGKARLFLGRWNSVNSLEARDRLVESFFRGV